MHTISALRDLIVSEVEMQEWSLVKFLFMGQKMLAKNGQTENDFVSTPPKNKYENY